MKLLLVTASMPFGYGEEFVFAEVKELLRRGTDVIVPRSPAGCIVNDDPETFSAVSVCQLLPSVPICAGAIATMLRHPRRTCGVAWNILTRQRLSTAIKNIAVLPKGLWLVCLASRLNCDHNPRTVGLDHHQHGYGGRRGSGIPWSFTAHRGDIVENNLLAWKTAGTRFTRYISESGKKMAASLGGLFLHAPPW